MSHGDMGPALKNTPYAHHLHRLQLRHDRAKSWRVGVAAFHADLSAANVVVSLMLPAAMPFVLWCAR
jgi:hypothetical protein